jgi:hypothetical protein
MLHRRIAAYVTRLDMLLVNTTEQVRCPCSAITPLPFQGWAILVLSGYPTPN